jgi:hypothetical protein
MDHKEVVFIWESHKVGLVIEQAVFLPIKHSPLVNGVGHYLLLENMLKGEIFYRSIPNLICIPRQSHISEINLAHRFD